MFVKKREAVIGCLVLCFSHLSVAASDLPFAEQELEDPDTFVTITVENDLFAGRDGGYTNGIGYSWGQIGRAHV